MVYSHMALEFTNLTHNEIMVLKLFVMQNVGDVK